MNSEEDRGLCAKVSAEKRSFGRNIVNIRLVDLKLYIYQLHCALLCFYSDFNGSF